MGCTFARGPDSIVKQQRPASSIMAPSARARRTSSSSSQLTSDDVCDKHSNKARGSKNKARSFLGFPRRNQINNRHKASCSETDVDRLSLAHSATAGASRVSGVDSSSSNIDSWMLNNRTSCKPRSLSASDFRTVTSTCGNSLLRISLSDDGMTLVVEQASVDGTPGVEEVEREEDEVEEEPAADADDNVFIATAVIEHHDQQNAEDVEFARASLVIASLGRQSLSTDAEAEEEATAWQPLQRNQCCRHKQKMPLTHNDMSPSFSTSSPHHFSAAIQSDFDFCWQTIKCGNEESESSYNRASQWQERCRNAMQDDVDIRLLAMTSLFRGISDDCDGQQKVKHRVPCANYYNSDVIEPELRTDVMHRSLSDFYSNQQEQEIECTYDYDDISQIFYHVYNSSSDSKSSSPSGSRFDVSRFPCQRTSGLAHGRPGYQMNDGYGSKVETGYGAMHWLDDGADSHYLPRLSQDAYHRQATVQLRERAGEMEKQQSTPVSGVISFYPSMNVREGRRDHSTPVSGIISYSADEWNFDSDSLCGRSSNASTPYVIFLSKQPIQL